MWNMFSLARWEYTIPFVHALQVFEMPVLGYAGYLPFGLECLAVGDVMQRLLSMRDRIWFTFIPDGAHIPYFVLKNYLHLRGPDRL